MNKAIFIDRDGVINQLVSRDGGKYSPRLVTDFQIFPSVPNAIKQIREAGYLVVVVTNQPDISRGLLKPNVLDEMHQLLRAICQVDAIYVCPHDNSDNCLCRKPLPGMLLQAATDLSIDLNNSWMIGDRATDMQAGNAVGLSNIFIASGQEQRSELIPEKGIVASFITLLEAIQFISG
jgi:D-glycero-D-manno-heptose 1,7-bisphosphate phosphatase